MLSLNFLFFFKFQYSLLLEKRYQAHFIVANIVENYIITTNNLVNMPCFLKTFRLSLKF